MSFIKMADLPPSPFDEKSLLDYKELGFNVCLLTEDDVKMADNGVLAEDYKKAIENISSVGLEVFIRNMYNDADYFDCEKDKDSTNYGTEYHMPPRKITDEFNNIGNVTGFYMADEAYMYTLETPLPISWMDKRANEFASFDKLKKLVEWKNKYYPDAFWHMNHVPSQSWDHYLPRNGKIYDYSDFLKSYTTEILENLSSGGCSVCLDNYPLIGEDYIEKDYLFDLLTAATVTKNYNRKTKNKAVFGICIQSFLAKAINDDRTRDIKSTEEITFQMFVGMALGAKLFEFFLYRTYDKMLGIIGPDGNKRELYNFVKTANEITKPFEDLIENYNFESAFVSIGYEHSENTAAFIMAKDLLEENNRISVKSSCDTLISVLDYNGKKGFMLVNYSAPIRNNLDKVEVTLDNYADYSVFYDGKEHKVKNNKFEITLTPGMGVFIY